MNLSNSLISIIKNFKVSPYMKRIILFLFGCIGSRSGLAYGLRYVTDETIQIILGIIMLIIGIGFITIFLFGLRKTGIEVGGGKIWWNILRPLHGILYIFAASSLMTGGNILASYTIVLDTIFGLLSFIVYHICTNQCKK